MAIIKNTKEPDKIMNLRLYKSNKGKVYFVNGFCTYKDEDMVIFTDTSIGKILTTNVSTFKKSCKPM